MTENHRKFFAGQRILIADESSPIRIAVARCLNDFGVPISCVTFAESFQAAVTASKAKPFQILFFESELGGGRGIELLSLNPGLLLSAIVTQNQSEIALARAAENDVDVFVTKPFSVEQFKTAVLDGIRARLQPRSFEVEANSLSDTIHTIQLAQDAKRIYRKAEYKLLLSAFESLNRAGEKDHAYKVLRRLVTSLPVIPERLSMVLRLAVETHHFMDVIEYYDLFLKMDEKPDALIRHLSAALVMAGKDALRSSNVTIADDFFKRAVLTSARKPAIIRSIVYAWIDRGMAERADYYIAAYPQHEKQSLDYVIMDYCAQARTRPLHEVLRRGQELLAARYRHPTIYKLLIEAREKAGHFSEAELLSHEAALFESSDSLKEQDR